MIMTASTTLLLPVAVAIGVLGIVQEVGIPGVDLALEWRQEKKNVIGKGLNYFVELKQKSKLSGG